ncbi:MAG: hypothetical protein MI741_15305, partial [Rhodospirillales bacterium]|nr:hypothetical protein [Rhodospirillales bacterium]
MSHSYDLAIVSSFNSAVEPFEPFTTHHIRNQIPVLLCNDGRYGGSGVHAVTDDRMALWWWASPLNGRLPRGDAILVADLDFESLAVQVGVSNPQPALRLVRLSSLAYEHAHDDTFAASSELRQIAQCSDAVEQEERLRQLQGCNIAPLQQIAIGHLLRLTKNGTADEGWWDALSHDCVVSARGNLPALESSLAGGVKTALSDVLDDASIEDAEVLGSVAKLRKLCTDRLEASEAKPQGVTRDAVAAGIIDRGDESQAIQSFLKHPAQVLCLVSGLSAVGKSSVIAKAFAEAGYRNVHRITLAPDATPAYMASAIIAALGHARARDMEDPVAALDALGTSLFRRSTILVIEGAGNLCEHLMWRDPVFPTLLEALVDLCRQGQAKIICESDVLLEFPHIDAALLRRVWVRGLANDDGVALLDQQIRRAGLDPANYGDESRSRIVTAVGGHPGAIVLVSEAIQASTMANVLADLQARKGVHATIVRRILRRLRLG